MSTISTASSSSPDQARILMRLEDSLRQIFWQNSSLRNEALTVIEQCLEQLPFGFHCSSTLSVLEKSYTEAPNLHIDSARKLIEIMTMISTRSGRPDFFLVVEVVTVLLGTISQHGIAQFASAVESMFVRFSNSLQMLSVSETCMRNYSRQTLSMFLPNENEILLTAGKALCLQAIVGTLLWKYGSGSTEIEKVWRCVRITIEIGRIEAIHASLAHKIHATGFEGFVHRNQTVELGAMLKAVVCPLDNAVNESDVKFCRTLCALITSILSDQSVMNYIRSLKSTDNDYIERTFLNLRSALYKCNFNDSRTFLEDVAHAKEAMDAIMVIPS